MSIFKKNIGGNLPDDFFTWLEILSGGEASTLFAEDGENSYAGGLDKQLKKFGFSDEDLIKVKIWWSSYPLNYSIDKGTVDNRKKVIQNDDHDTQYADYRGLVDSGHGCILTEGCEAQKHRGFEVDLFKNPYGINDNKNDSPIRMILSSFYTRPNGPTGERLEGLPDGKSDCKSSTKNCEGCKHSLPFYPAYEENGKAYSGTGFTRVHRDEEIINAMKEWMKL